MRSLSHINTPFGHQKDNHMKIEKMLDKKKPPKTTTQFPYSLQFNDINQTMVLNFTLLLCLKA